MYKRRKPLSIKHRQQISRGLKNYWKHHGIEALTVAGASAVTGAGLLLGKKKLMTSIEKAAREGFEKGAKEGVVKVTPEIKQVIQDEIGKVKPEVLSKIPEIQVSVEKAAERGFQKGAKEGIETMAPKINLTIENEINKAKPEIIQSIKQGTKEGITEGLQRKTVKETGRLELEQLREQRSKALAGPVSKVPVKVRLKAWVDYKRKEGIAGRKKNLGFRKYSNNFWIKFNNRKQKNIEFFNSKSSSYIKFSQRRKPMSEATKRKISKSLARSKGSTAGYDTEISAMTNRGNLIDNGIESIGKLTKAVSPILRYINERQNIAERKKRRQIQAVNTAIYGVGTGSRLLNTATSGKLARERLASRQNLLERQLQSREGLERLKADTRVRVETIKDSSRRISASAYKRQADSQRMKELSRMKIPPQTQTWNDLFNL